MWKYAWKYRELVVNFREERRGSLLKGLTAPRQDPLIQTAARGLLWWRPLQTQLFNRFWEDTEKFGIHPGFGGAGRGQTWGGGVSYRARQLLSIWSCQWHAVIGQLIVTSPERDQIAHACRGTLVRLGKKDGRNLSVWRERGTRDLSRRELALNRALRSSAPLFFPHRSLGGRKREGARGRVALWKEIDPRAQRGETDVLAVRTIRASECGICMGFPQAGNTLAVTVIGVQGVPARATVTARHLQQCRFALLGVCVRFAGWRQRTGQELLRCWGAQKRRISRADRGRWVQLRGVSTASRLLGHCRRSRRRWRRRNLRILWRNGGLYSQMAPPILAGSGGFRRHRLVQLRCRPIGSFFTHCTNQ